MINFSNINSFNKGQPHSFEELVCQIARKETFPTGSIFRRVEGSGGDGGVEAYWKKPDGEITGYQAKFFLRCGDINWDQIDRSVNQALQTHPKLECYVVALPCDLTDRSGKKRKGKTGWQHWDIRVEKWKNLANTSGINQIKFEVWTLSDLISFLSKPNTAGLRSYFFGQPELNPELLKEKVNQAIFELGDRYHPEDHVNVRAEKLLPAICRGRDYRIEIEEALHSLENDNFHYIKTNKNKFGQPENLCNGIDILTSTTSKIYDSISLEPMTEWDWNESIHSINKMLETNGELLFWCKKRKTEASDENLNLYDLQKFIDRLAEHIVALRNLMSILNNEYILAEKLRFAFIRGSAGSGKSHLLAKYSELAIQDNVPVILLLGQKIGDREFLPQVSQNLGLSDCSEAETLGAINSAGIASGCRFIILIDAINEGAGARYWYNEIASLISKLKPFPYISCIVSCRKEYFELAIPEHIATNYPIIDIRGFETYKEQHQAARVYLDNRGIARPSTPWLAPEFVNPLFLRTICLSLKRQGKSELPVGLSGTKVILKYYLESMASYIQQLEGISYSITQNLMATAEKLAEHMLNKQLDYIDSSSCREVVAYQFRHISPSSAPDWLSVLLNNGLLRTDPHPCATDELTDQDVLRFSFQRFQDFLMAENALDGVSRESELFSKSGKLAFCIEGSQFQYKWHGVLFMH